MHQKSQETILWEVMQSLASLAWTRLTASKTFLQRFLACLNMALKTEDLFCWCELKMLFLWTSWKPFKYMRYDRIFLKSSTRKFPVQRYPTMELPLKGHKNHSNQGKNKSKLFNEKEHRPFSLKNFKLKECKKMQKKQDKQKISQGSELIIWVRAF